MSNVILHPGDNRITLRHLIDQGVRVHSVVTDAPYGLVSVQKRFGKENSKPARTEKNDGSFARLSGGFMGKAWDGTGIERDPEFWALIYDILLPGGYVFAFSGSRTGHWQAVAMELAGFIMHPMHGWVFGSGFPKAVRKGLDTMPEWAGWAYGTQAQKPALEPIYLGQKPFSEKTGAANLRKHGVGAVNIDGCRVPAEGRPLRVGNYKETANNTYEGRMDGSLMGGSKAAGTTDTGRHPANLLHDGSDEVVDMFPAKAGAQAPVHRRNADKFRSTYGAFAGNVDEAGSTFQGDEGSAARFFHSFPRYSCERCCDQGVISFGGSMSEDPWQDGCPECEGRACLLPETNPIIYNGKAAKADRAGSKHPTVKPIALMRYLIRHITPPGGVVLDPFAGSGTTGEAAQLEEFDCILMEAEPEYVDFLMKRFGRSTSDHMQSINQSCDKLLFRNEIEEFADILGGTRSTGSTKSGDFDDVLG